jgi:predicted amidohydrolase YtcJ
MKSIFFVLLATLLVFSGCVNEQTTGTKPNKDSKADTVIFNGSIYTVDKKNPKAEAVAVKDGKIVFVGTSDKAKEFAGDGAELVDLKGKTMTPGFIDGHAHFLGVGYKKMNLDLQKTKSYEEIINLVAEEVKKKKPGEWILGRGWHQSKWEKKPEKMVKGFQTHEALSKVSPDNPVWLGHASGHAGFANAKAMEIAGVLNDKDKEIEGGEVIRDEEGNPTGAFVERAQGLVAGKIPENTAETDLEALKLASEESLRLGITSFQDAGSSRGDVAALKTGLKNGDLKVRIYSMLTTRDRKHVAEWLEKEPEIGLGDNFLTIRSIKIHADGALGSRGAWLLKPYTDRPETSGLSTEDMDYVEEVSKKALDKGYQVATHAIGDRTNREVLDRYEKSFEAKPEKAKDARFRIEHAQHISAEDIPRFSKLGIIAAMQAIHMSSDRPWAIDRLGEERIKEGAYVWRKLLDSGAKIVNGTDAPVEPLDPLPSFYASFTRKTLEGKPEGGYEPDQKMTREEALRSYTLDAAYGAFEEKIKGSIEVGKLADFTVWSDDIMQIDEAKVLEAKAAMTFVNGKLMFEAK